MDIRYPKCNNGLYRLNRPAIEEIATSVLQESFPSTLNTPMALDADEFLVGYQGLMLDYKFLGVPGREFLGAMIMDNICKVPGCDVLMRPTVFEATRGTVLITTALGGANNRPRQRYTKMHEGAHWILHNELPLTVCNRVEQYRPKNRTDEDWREWQADALAAALLMPKDTFTEYAKSVLRKAGATCGYLTEGNWQDCQIYFDTIGTITSRFGVSQRAAQIRMIHLGLIKSTPAF